MTPLQIETYLESIGGKEAFEHDPGIVDGWHELDPEGQDKVRRALEEGHVADKDWRGVSQLHPQQLPEPPSLMHVLRMLRRTVPAKEAFD